MTINEQREEQRRLKQIELYRVRSSQTALRYLRRISEWKQHRSELDPFYDILRNVHSEDGSIASHCGMPTIGVHCVMLPLELINAAGAVPVRLCAGNETAFQIGDGIVPKDACPLVKSVIGEASVSCVTHTNECKLTVVPITCDCKRKMAGMLSEYKKVFAMQVPADPKSDDSIRNHKAELYRLKEAIEQSTGNKITADSLRRAIEKQHDMQYELTRFSELKKSCPSVITGTQSIMIMNSFGYDEITAWTEKLRTLNDHFESDGKPVAKANRPRILLTGSPMIFPNIKIPMLIEENGGIVVGDETCSGERALSDPVSVSEPTLDGMMQALANRYLRPCSCPTFINSQKRIYRITRILNENKADGIIYHVLRGCLVYDYEYALIEETANKLQIPVIRLETDYSEEDIEQLRIRIEAFTEVIKFAKKRKEKGE